MITPKISIVIPAWNAEQYLERCLDSIKKQTFTEFEVIIADSESTDNTAEIAQSYARSDDRFRYVKHAFAPPGIGRNYGLDMARSPYIAFADTDDTLEPDMLETMYSVAITENADIVVCDFNMIYPDHDIPSFSCLENDTFILTDDNFANYYFQYSAAPKPNNYLWSRLYRRQFIRDTGIRFADTRYSEDHLFNLMLNCYMPRISHIGKSLYNYIQRDDSAVRQGARLANHGEIFYTVFDSARKYLQSVGKGYEKPILGIYAFTRIRSIVFYGQLAEVSADKLQESITSFLSGDKVEHYLSLCLKEGYLNSYCRIHNIDAAQEQLFHELIDLCLNKEKIALDRGWFS
ncbi:glycosyltransferase family 2 protein [Paenibacillus paeoniae]|uniref:Glycosyltransferase n=1 Tax=Paenibacillus paeoniae TaxID=2292705 RepID=A0A371P2K3_9BACL|nr:glycosyltransferase [Paenibacillus paeoniae]REK69576.1 glycosyltransferase [Paenibacillus paeoniae]